MHGATIKIKNKTILVVTDTKIVKDSYLSTNPRSVSIYATPPTHRYFTKLG
jgi:hypothetical protein